MDAGEVNELLVAAQEADPFVEMVVSIVLDELTTVARWWVSSPFVVWPDTLDGFARTVAALAHVTDVDQVAEWLTDIAADYALEDAA